MSEYRKPVAEVPEDTTATTARLGTEEWEVFCGSCDELLAECVWVDVNLAMVMNATAGERGVHLPPLHMRRYRMALRLPREWRRDTERAPWRCTTPGGRSRPVSRRNRIAEGYWNTAQLGQQVIPPDRIECPSCRSIQTVERVHRHGIPPLKSEEPRADAQG